MSKLSELFLFIFAKFTGCIMETKYLFEKEISIMFKTFWRDYVEMVCKPQWAWLRKHWIGYLVILAVAFAIGFAVSYRYEIRDGACTMIENIRGKLTKKD